MKRSSRMRRGCFFSSSSAGSRTETVQPVRILAEPFDRRQQRLEFEGLAVVALDEGRREPIRSRRHGDYRQIAVAAMGAHEGGEPRPVEPRHVQIEEGETGLQRVPETLHRMDPVDSGDDGAPESLETLGESVPKIGVIIDDEDATLAGHGVIIFIASLGCRRSGAAYWGVKL